MRNRKLRDGDTTCISYGCAGLCDALNNLPSAERRGRKRSVNQLAQHMTNTEGHGLVSALEA
jgi:hypothetical protein